MRGALERRGKYVDADDARSRWGGVIDRSVTSQAGACESPQAVEAADENFRPLNKVVQLCRRVLTVWYSVRPSCPALVHFIHDVLVDLPNRLRFTGPRRDCDTLSTMVPSVATAAAPPAASSAQHQLCRHRFTSGQ